MLKELLQKDKISFSLERSCIYLRAAWTEQTIKQMSIFTSTNGETPRRQHCCAALQSCLLDRLPSRRTLFLQDAFQATWNEVFCLVIWSTWVIVPIIIKNKLSVFPWPPQKSRWWNTGWWAALHSHTCGQRENKQALTEKNYSEEMCDTSLEQNPSARGKTSYTSCTEMICWVLLDNHKGVILKS